LSTLDLVDRAGDKRLDLVAVRDDSIDDEQEHHDGDRPATAATIVPVTTGMTMLEISAGRKISPRSTSPSPSKNQAVSLRSWSHAGGANIRARSRISIVSVRSSRGALERRPRRRGRII
jgi:hypothetical protein